jgi:polar amino acid transport system substrate-binding protein
MQSKVCSVIFSCHRHFLFCFSILACCLFILSDESQACELKIGWEHWPPYQFKNEQGVLIGLDVELMSMIMEKTGCSLQFLEIEWLAHLSRLKMGSLDVAISASRTNDREKIGFFSDPYRKENMKLFVRKPDTKLYKFASLSDISNSRFVLGVTSGYYYGENFERLKKRPEFARHLEMVRNDDRNILKLLERRIDGFLGDPFVAAALMQKIGVRNRIEEYPLDVYSCEIHAIFSRASVNPEVVDLFNQGLRRIKSSGEYDKLIERYLE